MILRKIIFVQKMKYLNYLVYVGSVVIRSGETVDIYELNEISDVNVLREWADHFRQNYCSDTLLDVLRAGFGLSRKDYLNTYKFPSDRLGFGPGTRSGDFAELLISDYLEFVHHFYVPKDRYEFKFNPNTSSQGTDVIGLKMHMGNSRQDDEMIVFEVKCQASAGKPENRLCDAITDSVKDPVRKGETLNAIRQRAIESNNTEKADLIMRFQNEVEDPYIMSYGVAAIFDSAVYREELVKACEVPITHPSGINSLIIIKKEKLMGLIHSLYEMAADC